MYITLDTFYNYIKHLIRDCKSGPYTECEGSQSILYAWAKDAPAKFLPKGEKHLLSKQSTEFIIIIKCVFSCSHI